MRLAERRRLTAVARGAAAADLYLRGSTLLNVYTGEVYPANVAVHGERGRGDAHGAADLDRVAHRVIVARPRAA